jgi:Uma2 family endonuclease
MAIGAMPSIVLPADHVAGPPQGHWTYEEYADIPDDDARYELLTGVLYMSPPPTDSHQFANNLIQTYLTIHVQFAGLGRVIGPPFNIILSPTDVVQPDVTVVLTEHLDRITQRGVVGAPDLVVEIASPSTATHDRSGKFAAYERAGVPEYWIVDPHARTVEVWVLVDARYRSRGVFEGTDLVPTTIVPSFPVAVEALFR